MRNELYGARGERAASVYQRRDAGGHQRLYSIWKTRPYVIATRRICYDVICCYSDMPLPRLRHLDTEVVMSEMRFLFDICNKFSLLKRMIM